MEEYYLNDHDETVATLEVQLNKITKRYVAKTLTQLEETHPKEHNTIVKRQMYWLKDDVLKLIQNNS